MLLRFYLDSHFYFPSSCTYWGRNIWARGHASCTGLGLQHSPVSIPGEVIVSPRTLVILQVCLESSARYLQLVNKGFPIFFSPILYKSLFSSKSKQIMILVFWTKLHYVNRVERLLLLHRRQYDHTFNAHCCTFYQAFLQAQNQ